MITGLVNENLEAVIEVRLRWKSTEVSISVILDTGFSEFLTLPPQIIGGLPVLLSLR